MQPHSKLGLVVDTILGLMLGFFVDDSSVDIVVGTGTSDKAPLEEVAVGAALELQTEHSWAAKSKQSRSKLGLVVGMIRGLKLGLSVDASVGKATLPVQKDCKNFQRYKVASGKGTKYNPCRGKL